MVRCKKCRQFAHSPRDEGCMLIPSPWKCPKGGGHEFEEIEDRATMGKQANAGRQKHV